MIQTLVQKLLITEHDTDPAKLDMREILHFHTIPVPSCCSQGSQPLAQQYFVPPNCSISIIHILSFMPFVLLPFIPSSLTYPQHFHTAMGARNRSHVPHTLTSKCILYKLKIQCHDLKNPNQPQNKTPH